MALYTNTTLATDLNNTKGAATTPQGASAPRTGVIQTYYDRKLLNYAKKRYVYVNFGQKRNIPRGNGKKVNFRRWNLFTPDQYLHELTEGVVPDGLTPTQTQIEATVKQYGAYVATSDLLDMVAIDPYVNDSMRLLGDLLGNVADQVARNALMAGTNVQYANGKTARASVAGTDILTVTEIRKAVRTLKKNHANPFTSGPDGAARRPHFICICSPDATYDLQSDSLWQDVSKYSNAEQIYSGEIGRLFGVVFVEASNAPTLAAAGASNADLQQTIVFGEEAYGVVDINGSSAIHSIVKPKGSANLHGRQSGNGAAEQIALVGIVAASSFSAALQGFEERNIAQVALQIAQAVFALRHNLRHRQSCLSKMLCQIAEGMVLVATCTDGTYEGAAVCTLHSIVFAVASCSRNGLYVQDVETRCTFV